MNFRRNSKGITLVSLVVTIIVLLILAGVSLSLVAGGDGILGKAESAVNATEEAKAKEKLEIVLAGILADKYTDENYNTGNYIDEKIIESEMIVSGNVVTVDGWQFEIDRSKPKIINALGKGQESEEIEILTDVQYNSTFSQATIKFTINYEGNLKNIQINGENQKILNELTKTVDKNGTYQIYVKDENDAYKLAKAEVTELAEDMEIRTAEDLVAFRDKVNKGATFEGKTVTLMNDLDLSEVCSEEKGSWTPIGNFAGIFEGNNKTIKNLWINTTTIWRAGLFEVISKNATIQNLTMLDAYIHNTDAGNGGKSYAGAIVGLNKGTVKRCANIKRKESSEIYCYVYASDDFSGPFPSTYIGGITGVNNGTISECYNTSDIIGYIEGNNKRSNRVGGIVGQQNGGGIIEECYNFGNLKAIGSKFSMLGGLVGDNFGQILNSYSVCDIVLSDVNEYELYSCGISGRNWEEESGAEIKDSYYETRANISYAYNINNNSSLWKSNFNKSKTELQSSTMIELLNNNSINKNWKTDTININNGYPVLKWQVGK